MNCKECLKVFIPSHRGSPQSFCSAKCRRNNWIKVHFYNQKEYNIRYYGEHGRKRSKKWHEAIKRWAKNNPKAILAHQQVSTAIQNKTLIKPIFCSSCLRITKLHGHHEDYNKPLQVIWLCASCHKLKHLSKTL